MNRLVFMVEELSMKTLLELLLPRILSEGQLFLIIKHEGKSDLEKLIPRKLKGWTNKKDRFIILRDQDKEDCIDLKRRLANMCEAAGRPETVVRIVCFELESWYLADIEALSLAFEKPEIANNQNRSGYRAPDSHSQPSKRILKLVPDFEKVGGARAIAPYLDVENVRSPSFKNFVRAVRRFSYSE